MGGHKTVKVISDPSVSIFLESRSFLRIFFGVQTHICVGVPIGSDCFVRAMMDRKLTELEDEVEKVANVLGEERHSLWTVLRSSTLHKLDYWLGLIHPSLMRESAQRMDRLLEKTLGTTIGTDLALHEDSNSIQGLKGSEDSPYNVG